MNIKRTTNSQLSTIESEKLSNKAEQQQKHRWQVQNRLGEVKNSIGNEEAKELIGMIHGHELRWGNDGGRWGTGWRGIKRRKNGTTVIA